MKKQIPTYFMIIPAIVWEDDSLTSSSKILYGHISTLTQNNTYCWASNAYFAKVMQLSERSVQMQLEELEKANHIKRTVYQDEENNTHRLIKNLRTPTSCSPNEDPFMGTHAESVTHNKTSINKTSKTAAPRKKTLDPQHEQASAEYELDTLFRWERLIRIWRTEEDSTFQRRAAKKHFWPMDGNVQEEIVSFVEGLGSDVKYLQKAWIGPMLKDGLLTVENIKQELEKRKSLTKIQGKYKGGVLTQDNF